MARTAILTASQCREAQALKAQGARAIDLAKQFGVSESSIYKVLDGSYRARRDERRKAAPLPVVQPTRPMGITPSLFASTAHALNQELHPLARQMLEKAQHIEDAELDDVTVAAAELVVAKARLNRILAHH